MKNLPKGRPVPSSPSSKQMTIDKCQQKVGGAVKSGSLPKDMVKGGS